MTASHRQDDDLRKKPIEFDQFLNEPPPYEDQTRVREYRHAVYPKWRALCVDIVALLAATPASRDGAEGTADPLADLVSRFSKALLAKLKLAQANGRSGWEHDDWEADCQRGLLRHVEKGDPRDVAAYCAFLWHHGWITTPPEPAPDALREALKDIEAKIAQLEHYRDNDCQLEHARTIADGRILQARQDVIFIDRAMKQAALSPAPVPPADGLTRDAEIVRLIDVLRSDEGDSVTILCDNPDFNGQPNCAVVCNGDWTGWVDKRFAADTVLDALSMAMVEKNLPTPRRVIATSNGHHWIERFNLVCCRDCGFVRRADDQNKPCQGPVGVGIRQDLAPLPARAADR